MRHTALGVLAVIVIVLGCLEFNSLHRLDQLEELCKSTTASPVAQPEPLRAAEAAPPPPEAQTPVAADAATTPEPGQDVFFDLVDLVRGDQIDKVIRQLRSYEALAKAGNLRAQNTVAGVLGVMARRKGESAVPELAYWANLDQSAGFLRMRAAGLLARVGGNRAPVEREVARLEQLIAEDPANLAAAVEAAKYIGTNDALGIIAAGLEAEDFILRASVARSLGEILTLEAMGVARAVADSDPSPVVREAALRSYEDIDSHLNLRIMSLDGIR